MNEKSNKIKIYLLKDASENDYLKKTKNQFEDIKIDDEYIKYRKRKSFTPKWYKNFFERDDVEICSETLSCFFDKTIDYENKKYKFVISFGSADLQFDLSKFVDNFGLKVAFSVCDKFKVIQKNNLSTTMSNNKEYSTKNDDFSAFVFNDNNDLIKKVTVTQNTKLFNKNLTGGVELSGSANYNYYNIDILLSEILKIYFSEKYKEKYDFIDNIKEIENDKKIIEKIKEKISELLGSKQYNAVWYGFPFFDKWEDIESFKIIYRGKEFNYLDLDIRCINSDFDITNYNQLKNIKVFAQISTDNFQYEFNLLECLYGEIKIDNEYYVVNSKKFYRIDKSYTEKVDKLYNSLKIYDGLPDRTKPGPESIYNSFVEDSNPSKFKNLDKKLYTISGKSKIELCDLYDIERKAFIHVKKNGSSSVLSHLFQQAQNSAKILCDKNERKKIIDFYKEKTNVNIEYNFQYEIVMAIITNVMFEKNEHINIPFFSKMSVVSAAKEIELMGFNPKIAFIYSSAPLHEKNR